MWWSKIKHIYSIFISQAGSQGLLWIWQSRENLSIPSVIWTLVAHIQSRYWLSCYRPSYQSWVCLFWTWCLDIRLSVLVRVPLESKASSYLRSWFRLKALRCHTSLIFGKYFVQILSVVFCFLLVILNNVSFLFSSDYEITDVRTLVLRNLNSPSCSRFL
jgi:hypothetical protein